MSTALTTAGKTGFSLTPQSLDEALRFADMLSKSSMVPKDYQGNPANCVIAMQWGMEIGLQPLQAMQNIAVINGRPAIWGDAMLAIVRGSGLLEYIREEPTESGCTCTLKRKGEEETVRSYTTEDAKRAGLLGKQGPWQQHQKRMMQMRARAFALRDVFPDVLRGVHIAEEVRDLPAEKDITPAEPPAAETAKPSSRAEAARQKLASRKPAEATPVVDVPSVDEVMAAIVRADTLEALNAVASDAGKLAGEEKDLARQAWKQQHEFLLSQQQAEPEQDDFLADLEAAEGA